MDLLAGERGDRRFVNAVVVVRNQDLPGGMGMCFDAIRLCRVVLDHDNDVLVSFRQATIRGLLSGAMPE